MTDFNAILEQIESWSLFELYRLRLAIDVVLNNPQRNEAIKRQLKVGMKITYFCSAKNRLMEGVVEEIRKTWVTITTQDSKRWAIKFYLINFQGIDTQIIPKRFSSGLDKNTLKVGDQVGWHSKLGEDLYGVVEKLNPKKALIRLRNGNRWTVPYSLLFLVMEGVFATQHNLIEGEVIR